MQFAHSPIFAHLVPIAHVVFGGMVGEMLAHLVV